MSQPDLPVPKHKSMYKGKLPHPFIDDPKTKTIIGWNNGLENMRFAKRIHEGKVDYDLNRNIDKAIHQPEDLDKKLASIQKFLIDNAVRLNFPLESSISTAQFITYRGLMSCVACTPYENQESWKIVAVLFKGNIYLCARDTDYKKKKRQNKTEHHKLCSSWGYKFEQYMLSNTPDSEPNPEEPVDENKKCSLVFKSKLNNHNIVYAATMDAIISDMIVSGEQVSELPSENQGEEAITEYLRTKKFVEIKTKGLSQKESTFRRFKARKWWCQSVLGGVETILCGLRNDYGIVKQLKVFNVKDLPLHQNYWNPNVCIDFLDEFFSFVKDCLKRKIHRLYGDRAWEDLQALPLMDMMFEWEPESPVKVNENYVYKDDQILQDWFIENYGKKNI